MFPRYVRFVVSYPKTIITLVLAVTLLLGGFIGRVHILLDLDAQIPPGHPMVVVSKRIETLFGGKFMTVIGLYPKEGTVYTEQILGKVQRITKQLEKLPGVKPGSVFSLTASRLKDIHNTEEGLAVDPMVRRLPATPAELAAFRTRIARNDIVTSLLVSHDGRATAVFVDFDDFAKAGGPQGFHDRLEAILAPEREAGVEILPAGAPPVLYWLSVYTRRVAFLFVVALAMIGYLHYRAFRTLQGMIVPLVTALMGVVWALGLMGLLRAPLDPWNVMTPVLLLAIGAGHSVQILKRYYEEYARGKAEYPARSDQEQNIEAVVEATVKVGRVMMAAGTIASLSFLSLAAFGLPSIRNFGLCAAFGIAAALIVEMTFIPAIRAVLKPPNVEETAQERRPEFFDVGLEWLARLVRRRGERPILWVFAALILATGLGATRLRVGNSLGEQFFEANGPVHAFRMADSRLAGTRVIQVLLEGEADSLKDPEVLARVKVLSDYITAQPLPIGKVVSIVDVVLQIRGALFNEAAPVLPTKPEEISELLMMYSMSGDASDLDQVVDESFSHGVITAYVKTDDFRLMKQMVTSVQAEADRLFAGQKVKATVGGGVTNAIALNETMVRGKTLNLVQISALVVIITALLMRSLVAGFLVLVPLLTAALVNLGLMGWLGIMLSMGTAAISAMAIGIGADYAVYFLFRVKEEVQRCGDLRAATATALMTSGKAIAYVATAVAGGYLCLTLSGFKVHVLLGVLVALTMVTSSLATVAFLPSVILRLQPKFLVETRRPRDERANEP